jgi:hypothetical protein
MLIQKLKILLFSLILVSIISNATLLFSKTPPDLIKSDLTKFAAQIMVKQLQLRQIWMKLITVEVEGKRKSSHDKDYLGVLEGVNGQLLDVIQLLHYEYESIITIPHIMEKYRPLFSKARIKSINNTKKQLNISLEYLDYVYDESGYKASLSAMGDPRKDILSALELLEKCIPILQQISEKK